MYRGTRSHQGYGHPTTANRHQAGWGLTCGLIDDLDGRQVARRSRRHGHGRSRVCAARRHDLFIDLDAKRSLNLYSTTKPDKADKAAHKGFYDAPAAFEAALTPEPTQVSLPSPRRLSRLGYTNQRRKTSVGMSPVNSHVLSREFAKIDNHHSRFGIIVGAYPCTLWRMRWRAGGWRDEERGERKRKDPADLEVMPLCHAIGQSSSVSDGYYQVHKVPSRQRVFSKPRNKAVGSNVPKFWQITFNEMHGTPAVPGCRHNWQAM
ncbi:hypothetical protein BKA67DRAFT_533968 [Truncatella angustata]|uniref:Uncharacterized protein n=1 Tax=Truncatella angustata TaxID=152316 RepID=A0A9P8UMJ8_9PEZI|nr:uncharacterized protein BKA67DRAFT_533968 [Truncatella angustata]KAH6655021.1 hypothetical protein BKA67DRAFT_533968 [Truncatella angustata]